MRKDDEYFESAPRWKSWCLGKVSLGPGALKLKTKTSKERRFLDSWLYVCESISIPFMEQLPPAISRSSTLITQSKNTWFIFSYRNTISQLTCLSVGVEVGAGAERRHGRPVGLLIWNAFSAPPSLRDVLKVLRTPFCAGVHVLWNHGHCKRIQYSQVRLWEQTRPPEVFRDLWNVFRVKGYLPHFAGHR